MPLRQHRLGVSADFIRDFARAPKGAVAAHNHKIDFPALKQVASRVVGDYIV